MAAAGTTGRRAPTETLGSAVHAVQWLDAGPTVRLLDQRRLPAAEAYLDCTTESALQDAIRTLAVRGAPAIGIAAAYGVAQAMRQAADAGLRVDVGTATSEAFDACAAAVIARYAATRPTAVNLFWALDAMARCVRATAGVLPGPRAAALFAAARALHLDDAACCLAIGRHGAPLLLDGGVITHCNTGALATGGIGTALGVVRTALAMGRRLHVYIDETRPLLQGARLTAWECQRDGIAATLLADSMAAVLLRAGRIQAAIVGADRIAANGDSANKIGTYGLAVLCRYHGVPFYVAAPTSTIDRTCPHGAAIPIEERQPDELTHVAGVRVAPAGVDVFNPAFDVTPAELIAGIVTEEGVARAPFAPDLEAMVTRAALRRAGGAS
ncbi:MAG: S-methyl-5-thioribose-1-phosphate isomerase [Myxococcales bacterium]|nr:S-methyl-5-thioribose-1-phosphate isomerase [Myxococcales bacterium]